MLTCEECLDHMGYNPCPGHPAIMGWPSECSEIGFCPKTRPNKKCAALGPGILPAPDGPIIYKTPLKLDLPTKEIRTIGIREFVPEIREMVLIQKPDSSLEKLIIFGVIGVALFLLKW